MLAFDHMDFVGVILATNTPGALYMKLIGFILRHIIPIGLLTGVGLIIFSTATPVSSTRISGIGVDLMSSPPLTQEAVEGQLNAIQQSGSEYVRIEVNWTLIEVTQDVYDWSNVMPLDLFFSSTQSRGIKSVAVITGFPIYLTAMGANLDQQTVGQRWEKFIQAAVDHFGGQVDYWQIGDQVNSTTGSRSLAQGDPSFYSKMLVSASKIIKKADSNDEVWMGSLVSAAANNCAVNPLTFLLEVNGSKGWNAADVIAYQPRRGSAAPENASNESINESCSSSLPGNSTSLSAELQSVQDLARQLGGKPVYVTGLTWSQEELATLQNGRSLDLNTLQSDLLVRASVMMMGKNAAQLIFWEINPLSQPVSMFSLANLSSVVSTAKSLGQIQGDTGNVQEYRFQKGADIRSIAWRSQDGDSAQPVNLSGLTTGTMTAFSADSVSLDSNSGTLITVDDSGSTIIMLNERPVIFTGKTGGWDDQIKAVVTDQLDIWRIKIQSSITEWLNNQKAVFLRWLEGLFTSAKDSAVDWGQEKIKELLN